MVNNKLRYSVEVTNDNMVITLMPELVNKHSTVFTIDGPVVLTFTTEQLNMLEEESPSRGDFFDYRDWVIARLAHRIAIANYNANEDFLQLEEQGK